MMDTPSPKRQDKNLRRKVLWLIVAGVLWPVVAGAHDDGWRGASRQSANIAPLPEEERNAVIQAYAARVWGWRGIFADHTWISVKPENADAYTVYEVIGWRLRRNQSVVRAQQDIPDRYWFGNKPSLLLDVRGDDAKRLIPEVVAAVKSYPYPDEYKAFPGPNSNTFIAWIARQVPELNLNMPARAVGKGYLSFFSSDNNAPACLRDDDPLCRNTKK